MSTVTTKTIWFNNEPLTLSFQKYYNGQNALQLNDNEGFPYMKASVALDNGNDKEVIALLMEDHVAIKNWSENTGILEILVNEGIISEPIMRIDSGYVQIPICKILIEK